MAKVEIVDKGTDWTEGLIEDIYLPLIEKLMGPISEANTPEGIPEKIQKMLAKDFAKNAEWKITLQANERNAKIQITGPNIGFRRTISRRRNTIVHDYFELGQALQGKGIADLVLGSTLDLSERTGISNVELNANLDVGGYAWLRKGFYPDDGKIDLLPIAERFMERDPELGRKLYNTINELDDDALKRYVLSEDFKQYKDAFLGSNWNGNADLNDEITRVAFKEGAGPASRLAKRGLTPPQTANEKILDKFIRHQTYLQRFSAGATKEAIEYFKATEDKLRKELLAWAEKFEGVDPISKKGKALIKELEALVVDIRSNAWEAVEEQADTVFKALAATEQAATMATIQAPFPVSLGLQGLPQSTLSAIVTSRPFEGRTLNEWLERNRNIDVVGITRACKNAMLNGQTPTQAARAAMGTSSLGYRDGKARKAFHNLESVYLTVTNGIGNEVKQRVYQENSDIIKTELFVATLDIRTTIECARNDGETFTLGKGPKPPLHFRCRSLRVPYINPDNLGNRGYDASNNKEFLREFARENNLGTITNYSQLPRGYKGAYNKWSRKRIRQEVGQVPATTSFQKWFDNQSSEFQREYLGPARFEIYRQHGLKLDKFVTRDGYELTVDQLNKLVS